MVMEEILFPGRERIIFLKSKITPRYSNCCLGMRFDFSQFTCIPRFWNSFMISFDFCINLFGDMAVIKKSSSRQKLVIHHFYALSVLYQTYDFQYPRGSCDPPAKYHCQLG